MVPPLWLKASSYRSLSGKVHGQLESALEGALAQHASSPTDVRVCKVAAAEERFSEDVHATLGVSFSTPSPGRGEGTVIVLEREREVH